MSEELIESDFDQEAETEEIENWFVLDGENELKWSAGDYFGADKI
jgi:hypothetical protein